MFSSCVGQSMLNLPSSIAIHSFNDACNSATIQLQANTIFACHNTSFTVNYGSSADSLIKQAAVTYPPFDTNDVSYILNATLFGLTKGASYYYQLVANNSIEVRKSNVKTFVECGAQHESDSKAGVIVGILIPSLLSLVAIVFVVCIMARCIVKTGCRLKLKFRNQQNNNRVEEQERLWEDPIIMPEPDPPADQYQEQLRDMYVEPPPPNDEEARPNELFHNLLSNIV